MLKMLLGRRLMAASTGAVAALVPAAAAIAAPPVAAVLVSQTAQGVLGNAGSNSPAITPNGRFVAFGSNATNLVPGDTNGVYDLFVRDLETGALDLVSTGLDGAAANAASHQARISDDGRFVTFYSDATNLVADDTNGVTDVFVRDRQEGTTTRVPAGTNSSLFPDISGNGRYVVFTTLNQLLPEDTDQYTYEIYLWDRTNGEVELLTPGKTESSEAAISSDGRFVAMAAELTGVYGVRNNIYLLDRATGDLTPASTTADGTLAAEGAASPSVSDDGRYIAFGSKSGDLVPGDTNSDSDIFLHDMQTGVTTLVSGAPDGTAGDSSSFGTDISSDGRYVGYFSLAANLTASSLPAWDAYTYVYDRESGTNTLASISPSGIGNGWSASLSDGGKFVAYESEGADLVDGDDNEQQDVFVTQLY
jgi:Tol biopolymer transport system component